MQNTTLSDKEYMADLLLTEKHLASEYSTFLSEAATPEVVQTLSSLLSDTHTAAHALFEQMNTRGWYPVTKAEEQKISETKQKFCCTLTK